MKISLQANHDFLASAVSAGCSASSNTWAVNNEGDCVFLYTGRGNVWHRTMGDTFSAENKNSRIAKFSSGEPGFGNFAYENLATNEGGHRLARSELPLATIAALHALKRKSHCLHGCRYEA